MQDFEPLRKYEKFRDAEAEAQRAACRRAKEAAKGLRAEAQSLMEQAKNAAADERSGRRRESQRYSRTGGCPPQSSHSMMLAA